MPVRVKGLIKTKTIVSPYSEDPNDPVQFTIKKASNREDVERSRLFSKIRYVQNLGEPDQLIQERDVAVGEIQIATILLCLVGWNITNEQGEVYPINEETLLDYLKPEERRWLFEKIMDFNPMWRGEEDDEEGEERVSDAS